jgi:hypothetical protein
VFAFVLFNGDLANFAWSIVLATVVTAPIIIRQQSRYFDFGFRAMVSSAKESFAVAIICTLACALFLLLLPATISPMARLLLLLVPLIAVWYGALRLTRHLLLPEVHHLVYGMRARLPQFG